MTPIEKARLFCERFEGREDVYSIKWYDKESGKGQYSPVCENKFKPGCHLKTKTGVTCAKCEIKATAPVTFDTVLKHISGMEEQGIYVLRLDGMIKFGALDLDCKPNRPQEKNYFFKDAKLLSDTLSSLGLKHGIARSTTEGFHIYMFFKTYVSAAKFRTVMQFVFEKTGMAEDNRYGVRLLPEVYPKQAYAGGEGGLGNCIKPPMIEPMFVNGKNCWVDGDNNPIQGVDAQWSYFKSIPDNDPAVLDAIIEEEGLEVVEAVAPKTRVSKTGAVYNESTGTYEPKTSGSFEKILEGCASLRKLREKMDAGYSPGHDEGMGLFHLALNTMDGIKYFEKGRVPGWGQNEKDWKQLNHSMDKNYAPWTCKKFQEKGICPSSMKCFDKKPPLEIIEGQQVIRNDLPESDWVDPSPMRYAYGDGEAFLAKLLKEVDELVKIEDTEKKLSGILDIVKRAQVFDKDQQTVLKQHIQNYDVVKKIELNKMFKNAEAEKEEALKEAAARQSDVIRVNSLLFKKLTPYGYAVSTKLKGTKNDFHALCNFDVIVKEQRTTRHDDGRIEMIYAGYFSFDGKEKQFEIPSDIWASDTELFKTLHLHLGHRCDISKADLDDARQAWMKFSGAIEEKLFYTVQGWYDDTYITPSVIVDKDGVKPNTQRPVKIYSDHARLINFKILSDGELRDILFHIKTDLFKAYPRGPLFIGLAQVFLSTIKEFVGMKHRPTVWYEGLTGAGKTSMTRMLQSFFGEFQEKGQNWTGTYKGMLEYCYAFKDAILVIDDYKAKDYDQIKAAEQTVQHAYDGTARAVMTKTGSIRGDRFSRCLLISSGEDTPSGDASVISRMCLIPYPKSDSIRRTVDYYERCYEMSHNYCGVTPMFIKFFLNQDRAVLKEKQRSLKKSLLEGFEDRPNASRMADHYSYNHIAWQVFVDFMRDSNAIDKEEADSLINEHYDFCIKYRNIGVERCSSEQQGIVFLDNLKEVIHSHRVSISGLDGYEDPNKDEIGFIRKGSPNLIYVHPSIAKSEVIRSTNQRNLNISLRAVGEQLIANKIIVEWSEGDTCKKVYTPDNKRQARMWVIDITKLGFESQIGVAKQENILVLPEPELKDGFV